ncbi:Conserved hypothetical protein [gamma proteobacterium HdN1]|nr:Conserved hypothetical protein [gamma proteobacterium HdN1]
MISAAHKCTPSRAGNPSLRGWVVVLACLLLSACASVYKPHNEPLAKVDPAHGYRAFTVHRSGAKEHLVALSFSGGGTRAAALSYGVMQELRDTQIRSGKQRVRLLDEVDTISAVSGGSFTAAYYGLFGDKLFTRFEGEFLRRSVQGALIRQMLDPVYWWRSLFTGFDRTEMAIEYYDSTLFRGKKFRDIPLTKRPFIEINATNLKSGQRFSFTQSMFDLLCSDVGDFSVARAVTASSAVPVAFPTVVLENYAPRCDLSARSDLQRLLQQSSWNPQEKQQVERYEDVYLQADENPWLHLVDGGISDNLGLRAILERVDAIGGIQQSMALLDAPQKDVLILLVNAAVKPNRTMAQSANKPSISATIDAFTDSQMQLYTAETRRLIQERITDYERELQANGQRIKFYFVEVSFESIRTRSLKNLLNALPTSLELSNQQVDLLIRAGRRLLRENPVFQQYLDANRGVLREQ